MVFASCFIFFVYDFTVLNKLIQDFPYQEHRLSSLLRFLLDLVMAFILFGVTWYAGRLEVEQRPAILYWFVSVWHLLAATWHVLANWQYGFARFTWQPILWHGLIAQAIYLGCLLMAGSSLTSFMRIELVSAGVPCGATGLNW